MKIVAGALILLAAFGLGWWLGAHRSVSGAKLREEAYRNCLQTATLRFPQEIRGLGADDSLKKAMILLEDEADCSMTSGINRVLGVGDIQRLTGLRFPYP